MSTHKQYITHQAEAEYKDPSTDQEINRHKMPRNKQGALMRQISSPETLANEHIVFTCFNFGELTKNATGVG